MKFGSNLDIVWNNDPKLLGIRCARYKFVSRMLTGFGAVMEVGAGDGFLSRIVQKEVDRLMLFDKEPQAEHVYRRDFERDDWQPGLIRSFDAAYALDVLEHVRNEARFMETICDGLKEHGTCIIGIPSLESQAYASAHSKADHVNCKNEDDFRALMQKYFHCVYIFTMHDEMIGCNFGPMAHYRVALCNTPRQ